MKTVKNVTKFIIMFILAIVVLIAPTNVNAETAEIVIKSMSPEYDSNSSVEITNKKGVTSVWFNDKNQSVKYNVVIQNKEDYDVKISDIKLTTPTEKFLKFTVEGIQKDDVLKAKETKELVISFETVEMDGWGRNFSDSLIANVTFDKVEKKEEVVETPTETPKEETKEDTKEEVKEEPKEETKDEVENPFTSNQGYIITLIVVVGGAGIYLYVVRKKKVAKYIVPVLMLAASLTIVNAEESIELPIRIDVNFKSQNVMKPAYTTDSSNTKIYNDFWEYRTQIKNIYIQNTKSKVKNFVKSFDVSKDKNERVMAYLVPTSSDSSYYDLYLVADGIIYASSDASYYFYEMMYLESVNNLEGFDTSKVTNMNNMFDKTGYYTNKLSLDLSSLDTSNVTSMASMFYQTGYNSSEFNLNLSNWNTSKVTTMRSLFNDTCRNCDNFKLDLSSLDTSQVTDMTYMFYNHGYNNNKVELDLSNFDTSKVTSMNAMFYRVGYTSDDVSLDISNFNTSQVTNMRSMFIGIAYSDKEFNLDVSHFDTSKVTETTYMFYEAAYSSTKFNTSITIRNNALYNYTDMFSNAAPNTGSQIKVNYTNATSSRVTSIVNNSYNTSAKKGDLVE